MTTKALPVLAFLLSSTSLHAQDVFLGEITVFANQSETELDRTGATVEIVKEDDIKKASPRLADALDKLPGVTVSANGGLGTSATVRIRGLDGAYIPVLIDGMDVSDPSGTQARFDWGQLTGTNFGRVEVLKGSQSARFGASAIGGVVNITSLQAEEPGTTVTMNAEAGSFKTYRAGLNVATNGERARLSFGVAHVQSEGFSARAAGTEPDGFKATRLNFTGEFDVTDTVRIGVAAMAIDSEGEFDEFGGDGAAPFDETNSSKMRSARVYTEVETGAVTHTLSYTNYKIDRVSSSNGFDTNFNGTRQKLDYKAVWEASETYTLTGGADFTREGDGTNTAETSGVFVEALYAPTSNMDVAVSLRYDNHSAFGDNISGRAALSYRTDNDMILRAVASNGFRSPSLYELYNGLYGNTSLQQEKSQNFELSAEKRYGDGSFVKVAAFTTQIDNLIQFFDPDGFFGPIPGAYAQVPGVTRTRGIELSGRAQINDRVALFGNYTLTDTDRQGSQLLRVPRHDVVLGVETDLTDQISASLEVNHVAGRAVEFGTVMADYTVVNMNVSYAITDSAQAYLRIENLADSTYQTSGGYNAAGRSAYFGVRASF